MSPLSLLTVVLLVLVVVLLGAVLARLRAIEGELARALRRRRRPASKRGSDATPPRRTTRD